VVFPLLAPDVRLHVDQRGKAKPTRRIGQEQQTASARSLARVHRRGPLARRGLFERPPWWKRLDRLESNLSVRVGHAWLSLAGARRAHRHRNVMNLRQIPLNEKQEGADFVSAADQLAI
jgi:hypothetical protein